MVEFGIPDDRLEQARMLENILVAACEGASSNNYEYEALRREFMSDPTLKALLPEFVRTCRDLSHFWGYIKSIAPKWEPRRVFVREAFARLFNHIEEVNVAPVDNVATDVLQQFDADSVHVVWTKALARRDPEGAITSARTLLETVCKRVLEETGTAYSDKDDLPALYKAVATKLNIAPSQHTQETFRRILGGATSVCATRSATPTARGEGQYDHRPGTRSSL